VVDVGSCTIIINIQTAVVCLIEKEEEEEERRMRMVADVKCCFCSRGLVFFSSVAV